MAQIFKDNQYPQILFKADAEPITVNTAKEYKEAMADGWATTHIAREYPKWVKGPDGVKVLCADAAEEAKLLQPKPVAEQAEAPRRGRPPFHAQKEG